MKKINKKPTILIHIRGGAVYGVVSDVPIKVITLDSDIQNNEDVVESQRFGRFHPYYEDTKINPKVVKETLKLLK